MLFCMIVFVKFIERDSFFEVDENDIIETFMN